MVAPDPLADSATEFELLDAKVRLADAVPVVVGAKVTVKGTLWPEDRVTGRESPLTVNSELFEEVEERVTVPPLAVTAPLCVCVLPMVTLPKLSEPGLTEIVPTVVLPVPERETYTFGFDALEARVRVALAAPDVVGANVTDKFAFAPALRV